MTDLTAKRTLVKSPPELWAELSEVESLARHLGEFGEIRVTRTDPQTTVAWEGEHASGTVELEESGWGTKVTLTAAVRAPEAMVSEPEAPPRAPEPEIDVQGTIEPPALPRRPEPQAERRGFFKRWRRRRRGQAEPVPENRPGPVMAAAISDGALTVVEKGHVARRPAGVTDEPGLVPEPGQQPAHQPAVDSQEALTVLETALDNLGQAHHRPFSRG